MLRQEQTNTFQDGIISDTHPLSTTNTAMTDALNATIVTYNGNEMILQNDMGNTTLKDNENKIVQLTSGFKPLGVKEHGGILYIVSTNGEKIEIGSFPGPDFSNDDIFIRYALNNKTLDLKDFTDTTYYDPVFPNLLNNENPGDIIKNSNLYKNISLINSDGKNCILKVGLEYQIKILENNKLSDIKNKKLYKVKFINLENDKDISKNIKSAIGYEQNFTLDKNYYYFPNIAKCKLGVRFEFEDIEFFKLGQTYQIINDEEDDLISDKHVALDEDKNPTLNPAYNGARYPLLTKNFEIIFQTIEYKTQSHVQVSHFYIEWELISKIKRNFTEEEKKLLNGSFYGSLDSPLYSPFDHTDKTNNNNKHIYRIYKSENEELIPCIIKLPQGDKKYYLKYSIYPIWGKYSIFDCINKNNPDKFIVNLHNDYKQTFSKWIISEEIDLELSPSLWGSKAKYTPANLENRYLSGDIYYSENTDYDIIKIGLLGLEYDFLENSNKIKNVWGGTEENNFNFEKLRYKYDSNTANLIKISDSSKYSICKGTHINNSKSKLSNLNYFNLSEGVIKGICVFKENAQCFNPINYNFLSGDYGSLCFNASGAVIFPNYKTLKILLGDFTIFDQNYKFTNKFAYSELIKFRHTLLNNPTLDSPANFNNLTSFCITNDYEYNTKTKLYELPSNLINNIDQKIELNENSLNLQVTTNIVGKIGAYDGKYVNEDYEFDDTLFNSNLHMLDVANICNFKFNTPTRETVSDEVLTGRITGAGLKDQSYWSLSNHKNFSNALQYVKSRADSAFAIDGMYDEVAYYGQFNSWIYNVDCSLQNIQGVNYEGLHLELKNELNLKYIPYFIKSRNLDDEVIYLDNFNNIISNLISQKIFYVTNKSELIDVDKNKSSFNKTNSKYQKLNYSIGILAPYPINIGVNVYNFVDFNEQDKFTYNFENVSGKYINIRFYLSKHYYNKPEDYLKITPTGFTITSIYTQSENSDFEKLSEIDKIYSKNIYAKPYEYRLVLVIGIPNSQNINIMFENIKSESGGYSPTYIIRNIAAYEQFSDEYYTTFAITTYRSDNMLYKDGINGSYLSESGVMYCYLPEPNYVIDTQNPYFTVKSDGTANINGDKKQIIIG